MLIPGFGEKHARTMQNLTKMGCVEVAIRDTEAGLVSVNSMGRTVIKKSLNAEDLRRKKRGQEIVRKIFRDTGARDIIEGSLGIGLHLMGGCGLGAIRLHPSLATTFSFIFQNVFSRRIPVFFPMPQALTLHLR